MNEIEKMLQQETRKQKEVARNARKKVTHGGCTMPQRTHEELKALNGDCLSYDLSAAMNWRQFTSLPEHVQKAYLLSLVKRFKVDETKLPALFGSTFRAVTNLLSGKGMLGVMKNELARMGSPEPDLNAWQAFCDGKWLREKQDADDKPVMVKINVFQAAQEKSKQYRKEHGISQRQMAALIGVSQASISRAERQVLSDAKIAVDIISGINRLQDMQAAIQADEEQETAIRTKDEQTSATVSMEGNEHKTEKCHTLTLSGSPNMVLAAMQQLLAKEQAATVSVAINLQM